MAEARQGELRICEACKKVQGGKTHCPLCGSTLTLADFSYLVGSTFGKYHLEGILGLGGMGVVYRATHVTLHRSVALKCILPEFADEEFLRRFIREARVLAGLNHPNIVEIYDHDLSSWGIPYYVMELLEGETLRDRIILYGGRDDPYELLRILKDIVAGLAYAHKHGVVHRDLKPDNIFIARYDHRRVPKILDFGIAKMMSEDGSQANLTTTGSVLGTPNYLAPEQILGQEVGPRADQYTLALITAEMFTGTAVREGLTVGEICGTAIRKPLPQGWLTRKDLPLPFAAALHRATQPDPAQRYASVTEFYEALDPDEESSVMLEELSREMHPGGWGAGTAEGIDQVSGESGSATEVSAGTGGAMVRSRAVSRGVLWFAGLSAVVLLLIFGWIWYGTRQVARSGGFAGARARSRPLLEFMIQKQVPPDTKRILDHSAKAILLEGEGCVYMMNRSGSAPPVRVPLEEGRQIVGAAPAEGILLRDGNRILRRHFLGREQEPWASAIPEGGEVYGSPDGTIMLRVSGDRMQAYRTRSAGRSSRTWQREWSGLSRGNLALGNRYLGVRAGATIFAMDAATGEVLWRRPYPESGADCIAVNDDYGYIAVGGWFDRVYLYFIREEGRVVTIPKRGQTHDLIFLCDGPTLVVAGDGGLFLWREDGGELARWGTAAHRIRRLYQAGGMLCGLDDLNGNLYRFAYRGFPLRHSKRVSLREIWAVASDPETRRLYVGGIDGNLYVHDYGTAGTRVYPLHTQGITSIVGSGDLLATASDDRTIAAWKTPQMEVIAQVEGHGSLVNQLHLNAEAGFLWSSSSDGTLRKWSWPHLDPLEEISTRSLLGVKETLQALWVHPREELILAGTWSHRLLALRKDPGGGWRAEVIPVQSRCLYSAVSISGTEAVLLTGFGPKPGVYLYDLRTRKLVTIERLGLEPVMAVALQEGQGGLAIGEGGFLRVRISRSDSGDLEILVSRHIHSEMGEISAGALLSKGGGVAVGNAKGQIFIIHPGALSRIPDVVGAPVPP